MAGKLYRPRKGGNRGKGGRPRKDGPRTSGGRVKMVEPNPTVMSHRAAMGLTKSSQAFTPLGVAQARRWLDDADIETARTVIALHGAAKMGGPKVPGQTDLSNPESVDVRAVRWTQMPDADVVAIWESAMRDVYLGDPEKAEALSASSWARWKVACAAMTPEQRREVTRFCIDDSWPQWILQRNAGRMETSWETGRDHLVSGLAAVRRALARPRPANDPRPATAHPRRPANDIAADGSGFVPEADHGKIA